MSDSSSLECDHHFLRGVGATGTLGALNHFPPISTSIPPGKEPLSQRTVSSLGGTAPPPGTWHHVRLQPAGRGHSCRRPTTTH